MDKPVEYTFSELLSQFRGRAKITQQELGDMLGVNRNTISAWERGNWLPKTRSIVEELAKVLHLDQEEENKLLKASFLQLVGRQQESHDEKVTHPPAAKPSIWNVPYRRNPFFTGRQEILSRLHEMLTSGNTAALAQTQAISGLGGIGKTQTAIEYAHRYSADYQTILWARADSREMLISDFVTIANLLDLPEKEEQDQSRVVNACKCWLENSTNWLLIFDNADDLMLAGDFLPTKGGGHTLLTTRAQATGSIAQRIELEKLEPEEGVLFLLRRTKLIAADASLDQAPQGDRATALELWQALDGLPLALDQAAAYVEETDCGLSGYLERYQTRRTQLLGRRGRCVPDHPEPVATTWSLSFEKVQKANPASGDLLRFCTFLQPDAIPEEIITNSALGLGPTQEIVAADVIELDSAISELRRFSLLHRNPDTRTLSIHRLVQAVMKDKMGEDAQHQWAERAVRAVNWAFPDAETFANWQRCQRCLPHAQVCATLIEQWNMRIPAAARLLYQAGAYLSQHAQYAEAELLLRQALVICEQTVGPEHLDVAEKLNKLADIYMAQGKYVQAESLFQRALTICEQTVGPEHIELANSLNNLALLYRVQYKYAQAELFFQRVVVICEKILNPKDDDLATSLNNLAMAYHDQGKYAQAEPLYQRALAIRQETPGHPELGLSLNNLGLLYYDQGKYAQAEQCYQQALVIRKQAFGEEHPAVANSLNNLGLVYYVQGEYTQAEALFQQALAIFKKTLGPEHPEIAYTLSHLGGILRVQGKYAQAEPLLIQSLAIWEKTLGPNHPQTTVSLGHLAELYHAQKKYGQAEPLYLQVLAIREPILGHEHPQVGKVLNSLGRLYYDQSKYTQAESLIHEVLVMREQMLGPDHPHVAQTLNNLALLYSAQGKYGEAEPLFQRALDIREQSLGPDHPDVATVLENYADLLGKTNREADATQLEARARRIHDKQTQEDLVG